MKNLFESLDTRGQIRVEVSTCVWLQLRFLLGDQVEASVGWIESQLWWELYPPRSTMDARRTFR